jgi:anti-sigma regulatory factor (Ser/Thr protein kinase)
MTGADRVRSDATDDDWLWAGPPDRPAQLAAAVGLRRPRELSLRLRPVPFAATKARKAVRAYCTANGLTELADDAELMTSELVTNAVAHARYLVTLHVSVQEGQLTVTVTDDAGRPPEPTAVRADARPRGRGLFLVAALAADWGLDIAETPTTAWFRLPAELRT